MYEAQYSNQSAFFWSNILVNLYDQLEFCQNIHPHATFQIIIERNNNKCDHTFTHFKN